MLQSIEDLAIVYCFSVMCRQHLHTRRLRGTFLTIAEIPVPPEFLNYVCHRFLRYPMHVVKSLTLRTPDVMDEIRVEQLSPGFFPHCAEEVGKSLWHRRHKNPNRRWRSPCFNQQQ